MEIQHSKKHSYLDQYKIIKTLGAGYHAQVKLGEDENGNLVAIKKYKKETATLQTLKHQLNIMKQLDHDNLVKLISVRENATYKKKDETSYNCFAIVLEYVGGGQLFDFVAETGKFSQKVTRTYFHQMMNGLHYMHSKGFAHRDIKPENILLSHLFILKLADFGFSCLLKGKDGTGILKTKLGTEGYMAPQIANKNYEGKSCDIFASGVILFIMYAGNPPFEKATVNDPYYRLIKEKKYDTFWKAHLRKRQADYFKESFKDLFVRMVAFEPTDRPKIQQIASHPWIKETICSHGEIKEEFTQRQKKLDVILQSRRKQQEKEKESRLNAVTTQGTQSRGQIQADEEFISLYNKEFNSKRNLPEKQETSVQDITLKEDFAFSIAQLKLFLQNLQIALNDGGEEDIIGDETDILRLKKIEDENKDTITATFEYLYEVDQTQFQQTLQVQILLGRNKQGGFVFQFERIQGNLLYYKKLLCEIKRKCFAL